MTASLENKRICVTGGAGFLGRAVCSELHRRGASDPFVPRSTEFDLTDARAVERLFDKAKPEIVIHLAGAVGGIGANEQNAGRFFHDNMAMGLHLIEQARKSGVEKFVQVGTVCAYPENCAVPFKEDVLWDGYPEPTNAPYGVAKRALGVMLAAYRDQYGLNGVCLIPVNLYGPHDSFDPQRSHVIPAMIRRFREAVDQGVECVECWGTGKATREFLYVEDAAEAIVTAACIHNDSAPINLGTGQEITIAELATTIARLVGYRGRITWNADRTDGQPRRSLDTQRATSRLGWKAKTSLEDGLRRTIDWWKRSE